MNNRTVSFTTQNLTVPAADIPMPYGITGPAALFAYADSLLPTDARPSIVNSDRIGGRQSCLLRNAGSAPRTGFAPVASKTRGTHDAYKHGTHRVRMRSVPTANTVGVDECARAHQHKLIFFKLNLCNRRI